MKLKPEQAIDTIMKLVPCPVVHELPAGERPSRSCYAPKRHGRAQDFIYMNTGSARSWNYVQTLAHEIGHALDFNGKHPLQSVLRGARSRYRAELAAVCFEFMICRAMGIDKMKSVAKRLQRSRTYLERYTRNGHQSLDELLDMV